jgi:hypothetical protein
LHIISTSSAKKILQMRPLFQSRGFPVMRSPTIADSGRIVQGEIIENVVDLGIHLSIHIATDFPSPIHHKSPALSNSRPDNMLHYANEGLPILAVRKLPLGKYFSLIIVAAKLSGCWTSLQHYFARRALLKLMKS